MYSSIIGSLLAGLLAWYFIGALVCGVISVHVRGFDKWADMCPLGGRVGTVMIWPLVLRKFIRDKRPPG